MHQLYLLDGLAKSAYDEFNFQAGKYALAWVAK
jgi:hypothetical protein